MEIDESKYLDFDVLKIKSLKDEYESSIEFILSELPAKVNWSSSKQIKLYFENALDIKLESVKISHILSHLDEFPHDSPGFDLINGLVLYLKQKYTLKNYLDCILFHQINGRVHLRFFGGRWVLPNRQPIPTAPEITACVIARKE